MRRHPRALALLLILGLAIPAAAVAKNGHSWWKSAPVGPIPSLAPFIVEVDDAKLQRIIINGRKHSTQKIKLRDTITTASVDGTVTPQTIGISPFELVDKDGTVSILVEPTPVAVPLTASWKSWTFTSTGRATVTGTGSPSRAPFDITVNGRIEKEHNEYELEVCIHAFNSITPVNGASTSTNGSTIIVLRMELEGEVRF